MSAAFSIEMSSIVATLPRPIGHLTGRYVVSDVHGGTPGSRKRKRAELAVGIDGEGLNIYDIQSSKLITSYAIPPHSSFTCPPSSLRLRKPGKNKIERRTYVSTEDPTSSITLFQDSTTPDGITESTVVSKELEGNNRPVIFLTTVSEQGTEDREDLLFIRRDGEIQCLDGSDLHTRWTSPASTISRNTTMPDVMSHKVEFAQLSDAYTASKRLLRSREDIFATFSQEISADGFNPPILVIITRPTNSALISDRTVHIVTLPRKTGIATDGEIHSVHTLLSVGLPWLHPKQPDLIGVIAYNLHVASGVLYELGDQYLTALDLSGPHPKVQSRLYVNRASSFLPLSSTSIITASEESVDIYHPAFHSLQASINLKSSLQPISRKRKIDDENTAPTPKSCILVTYSPKQGVVYAIAGSDLVAFQIDTQQDIPGQRRTLGLLVDSLGCGVGHSGKLSELRRFPLTSLGPYHPNSEATFDQAREDKMLDLDRYALAQDVEAFERLMAQELGLTRDEEELRMWEDKQKAKANVNGLSNGVNGLTNGSTMTDAKPIPRWLWPKHKSEYPDVDPKWVQYALSKVLSWSNTFPSSQMENDSGRKGEYGLGFVFFPHNVVNWLVETGNFNQASIQSALRNETRLSGTRRIPAGQIVRALVYVDPEFKMLFSLLSNTYLDAAELLHAIQLLMQSLELFGDEAFPEQHLLNDRNTAELINGDMEAEIEYEQQQADMALRIAEYHLGDHSNIRGRALSLALAKLYSRPASAIVLALRSVLTSAEIVSLIYLLRFELARGAWTSRYLDTYQIEGIEGEAGHENTILLVSGLLNCCIDAIGAGGWLSGDAMLVNGDHFESEELIASLKLEVSAALEGIEEASYLKGLTAEMVRYGEAVQRGSQASQERRIPGKVKKWDSQPLILPQEGRDVTMLPFGLKSEQPVSLYGVGSGGEIYRRTARDIGRLKSKKVGKYSRERIVI